MLACAVGRRRLTTEDIATVARQLASALVLLHERDISHRNLALQTICVASAPGAKPVRAAPHPATCIRSSRERAAPYP